MDDLHQQWPHRWINPKASSKKSALEGLGVFATKPIAKGEIVGVLGGVIVSKTQVREYWQKMGHVGIQVDEDYFIVPTSRKELHATGVFNHSCNPNIGFKNSITLVAIKDIEPEEELVFDYAFNETEMDTFQCNCQSENCRKTITKGDWQNKEIQAKYKEFFSPYLRSKF